MIFDCINMLAAAFCSTERVKKEVVPDEDVFSTAVFISMLSGKCEINEYHKTALIKPLKKLPSTSSAIIVPHSGRDLIFLIAGIAAQLDITVCFEDAKDKISADEIKNMLEVTQNTVCFGYKGNNLYMSSQLFDENPVFDKCNEPCFAAGLCIGGVLARQNTLVDFPDAENDEIVGYTLDVLLENDADVSPKYGTDGIIISTSIYRRFANKIEKTDTEQK